MASDESDGMEFWQEEAEAPTQRVADVADLAFALTGRTIPVDHAESLAASIYEALPWFSAEPFAGLHLIHTAASGNGWYSPADGSAGIVYLSRRTRLVLRLPHARLDDARALSGTTLDLLGHSIAIGDAHEHRLTADDTLYSRHIRVDAALTEPEFLVWAQQRLAELGIQSRRMIGGRGHHFEWHGEATATRSLMVADLAPDDSFKLQTLGLGEGRHHGFGLFVPHKAVTKPV